MKKIDCERLASDIGRMAFRTIDPDKPLNIAYDIGGDEAQSLLERVCDQYRIDKDLFWSKIDFDKHFFSESDPVVLLAAIARWVMRRPIRGDAVLEPFTIGDLVRLLHECETTQRRRSST